MNENREEITEEVHSFKGLFADMLTSNYAIVKEKAIGPDENTILFDFSKLEEIQWRVIGCSARIFSLEEESDGTGFTMKVKAADNIKAYIRIRIPKPVVFVSAKDEKGNEVPIEYTWDEESKTELFSYDSHNDTLFIKGYFWR